jgi:hypothetical protein
MGEIHNEFIIFNYGMKNLYETVDRWVDRVLWNPEGIKQARYRILYEEHGLRSKIMCYLAERFPALGRDLRESLSDDVIADIEYRFRSAWERAEYARQIVERHTLQNPPQAGV